MIEMIMYARCTFTVTVLSMIKDKHHQCGKVTVTIMLYLPLLNPFSFSRTRGIRRADTLEYPAVGVATGTCPGSDITIGPLLMAHVGRA